MTEENKERLKRVGRSTGILTLNVVAMIIIIYVASFWIIPGFLSGITDHDARVTVSDVVGMDADEAIAQISAQGLVAIVVDTVFTDGHKAGIVLDQLPEGNLPVKPGRNVYLTINSYTTQNFAFPDVVQQSSRQARSELEDQFFVVDSIILKPYRFDDLVLDVRDSNTDKSMMVGKKYPKRTHVVMVVGSSTVHIKPENDENEDAFFE